MKGIILAAGAGTRLYPLTKIISKPLLAVFDRQMIYYPLYTLILAGIKEILLITSPGDLHLFKTLLGDGSDLGIRLYYKVQKVPKGIADGLIIAEEFIGNDKVCLILGDNIFHGGNLVNLLEKSIKLKSGAIIFGYKVDNPKNFGVIEFDENLNILSIEEKPQNPKSNYIVPGIYFYDNNVVEIAKRVKPSSRGELEITSVNNEYLKANNLKMELLSKDVAWFDAGTFESLKKASDYIYDLQKHNI